MKRFKIMGATTVTVVFAVALVGASSAWANSFESSALPADWSGSLLGKSHALNLGGEPFNCEKVSFGPPTTNEVSTLTVSPELSSCSWVNNLKVGWSMNGCKYRFHAGSDSALTGWIDIVNCEKPMTMAAAGCTIEIGNQSNLGPVTYKNVAGSPSTVTAAASLSGITYTRSGVCGAGSPGTFSNGTYTGEWTVKGSKSGAPVSVQVKATTAPYTGFHVEKVPATLSASSVGSFKRVILPRIEKCNQLNMSGGMWSAGSSGITLVPSYKECTVTTEGVVEPVPNITAGGCSYVLYANGKFEIAGETCASNPIIATQPGCVTTVGPQGGLVLPPPYQNEGWGPFRTVSISASGSAVEGITYTATGAGCPSPGTFSNGKIWVAGTFSAQSAGASQGLWVE